MINIYCTFVAVYEKSMHISFDCDTTCPTLSRRRDFSSRFAQAFFNSPGTAESHPLFSVIIHSYSLEPEGRWASPFPEGRDLGMGIRKKKACGREKSFAISPTLNNNKKLILRNLRYEYINICG